MPIFPPPTAVVSLFGQAQGPATPTQLLLQVLPFLLVGVAAWTLLYKPERERMKRQQDLLSGLKKNDRVVTSSGIYGTVASVDAGADRVVLRVDESANVKLTVTVASIAKFLGDGGEAAEPKPS